MLAFHLKGHQKYDLLQMQGFGGKLEQNYF